MVNYDPIASVRTASLICLVPVFLLAIIQASVAALTAPEDAWPVVTVLMVPQVICAVAAFTGLFFMIRVARTDDDAHAAEYLERFTRYLTGARLILLGAVLIAMIGLIIVNSHAAFGILAFSAVGVQAYFALAHARRYLTRALS